MKKGILIYTLRYGLFMLVGHWIQIFSIPSIYHLPWIVLIPYNFLAIRYEIQKPLSEKRDLSWKESFLPLVILTSLFDVVLLSFLSVDWKSFVVLLITHWIEMYLMRPQYDKNHATIEKNIKEYYQNKN